VLLRRLLLRQAVESRCWCFRARSIAFEELVRAGSLPADAASTPPLHPTQLYEAGGELAIFFVLLRARRRLRFHGATALLYAILYGTLRSGSRSFAATPVAFRGRRSVGGADGERGAGGRGAAVLARGSRRSQT